MPFDHDSGFMIIDSDRFKVLCLRLESNQVWRNTIRQFLGLDGDFELAVHNDAKRKSYAPLYGKIRSNLNLSRESLQRIYSTKFARHFYTDEMRYQFLSNWTNQIRNAA